MANMNLVDVLNSGKQLPAGGPSFESYTQHVRTCLGRRLENQCSSWKVVHTASSFTRRVTAIRWHPVHPDVIAYGTHGGDVHLWRFSKPCTEDDPMIKGVGMGYGCITEMRFHPHQPLLIYTTAVDGRFSLSDFEGRHSTIILDSADINYWLCSLDFSIEHGVIVVGNNHGSATLLDLESNKTIRKHNKLHKGKIKYAEFCPSRNWMLATASVDRTVKLWDIRMLRSAGNDGKPQPLSIAEHSGVVSSAYFDPISGVRLLTTAQNEEIRVYDSHNLWKKPTFVISHPHRNFQHMTDIKATWHPLYDNLCVVGRYPKRENPDQSRTVDLIDLGTGKRTGYFYASHLSGIIQLNQFNKLGDCLASGMGYNGLIWKFSEENSVNMSRKQKKRGRALEDVLLGSGTAPKKRRCSEGRQKKDQAKKKKLNSVLHCEVTVRPKRKKN